MSTENKKLIAEFMELSRQLHLYEHPLTGEYVDPESLNYDTDWNMLMPVVEKIESLGYAFIMDSAVRILDYRTNIKGDIKAFVTLMTDIKRIEATYKAVVEFIKWHQS